MSLLRLFLFLLLCYVVLAAIKAFAAGRKQRRARAGAAVRADGEEMVQDPQCQSYVPKSEAVFESGRYFCSRECARLYLAR